MRPTVLTAQTATFVALALPFLCSACGLSLLEQNATSEVGFFPSGSIQLYYAFDIPNGGGPHPVVVFGHGSQRETANNLRGRAGRMVQQGIAVLRYDKRGVGRSEGTYSKSFANLLLLAEDMAAAVEWIRDDPRIDPTRIGLLGASQAGWVIPHAAARSPEVDFIILLSGPTVTAQQANYWDSIADDRNLSIDELENRLSAYVPPPVDFDGRPDLEKLVIPGLWLFGEEDRIIPARSSTTILQELVESDGKRFSYIVYPGEGHSLDVDYWPDLFAWFDQTVR